MSQTQPNSALHILKNALSAMWTPFSRPLRAEPGQAAQCAKFDSKKWTPALLKHLEWRRFEELCAAYFEAMGYDTRVSCTRPGGSVDIGLIAANAENANAISILVHCKAWDAYRIGAKPLRDLRAAMSAARVGEGIFVTSGRFTQDAVTYAAKEHIQLI